MKGNLKQQRVTDIEGKEKLAVSGIEIPPYATIVCETVDTLIHDESVFEIEGNRIETPLYRLLLDEDGYITSYQDKTEYDRELVKQGTYPWNTLLIAEDVPMAWDNWDLDEDTFLKFKPAKRTDTEIISIGSVELRIRNTYMLTERSTVVQDMVLYADSKMISFETVMDWNDHHRLLKTAFECNVIATSARHEIQFGHVLRSTTQNNDEEKAMFEVCAHKYSDISEHRFGITLLNDCKYGVRARDTGLWLSLHKGGTRPDYKGDLGRHSCKYAILPHQGGFSSESVVKPAYLYNYLPLVGSQSMEKQTFASFDCSNVIIETIKPCEDSEHGFIIRMYECEGSSVKGTLNVLAADKIQLVNLLEEPVGESAIGNQMELIFKPFEIKTVKIGIHNK